MSGADCRISVIANSVLVFDVAETGRARADGIVAHVLLNLTGDGPVDQAIQRVVVKRFLKGAALNCLVTVFATLQVTENVEVILQVLDAGPSAKTGLDRFQQSVLRDVNPVRND